MKNNINVLDKLISFSDALNLLIPIFEREGIGWKKHSQYHDFDNISEALFDAIVIKYLQEVHNLHDETAGYRYDFDSSKSKAGFFFSNNSNHLDAAAFQRVEEDGEKFSHAVFAKEGTEFLLPIDELKEFCLVR